MRLQNGRVTLELQLVVAGEGTPLLLLHELGSCAKRWDVDRLEWPGPVYALDFAGHGRSGRLSGGGYHPESYLADADLGLEQLGDRAAVAGAGIGAYVALLLAGARPDRVPAALLLPGRGLAGGGSLPDFERSPDRIELWEARIEQAARSFAPGTDPAVAGCETDVRPVDYACDFARAARQLLFSGAAETAHPLPEWWRAAREVSRGEKADEGLVPALAQLRAACGEQPERQ